MTEDSPTLGAWRRGHGITGWSDEGKHLFAMAVVEEARRRALLERLDSVMQFLAVGATVDQAAVRIAHLLQDIDPRWWWLAQEAAA